MPTLFRAVTVLACMDHVPDGEPRVDAVESELGHR